jgi:hypothetical protein
MKLRNPVRPALLAALAATVAVAFAAPTASATIVKPAGETAGLKSTNSTFLFANGYSEAVLTCAEVTTEVEVPANGGAGHNNNINRKATGTHSRGPGSVSVQFRPPTFKECKYGPGGVFSATLTVQEGNWPGAALSVEVPKQSPLNTFALDIPQGSIQALISYQGSSCKIQFAPTHEEALTGAYATHTLTLDGQVQFKAIENEETCNTFGLVAPAWSPAQLEGSYANTAETLTVEL